MLLGHLPVLIGAGYFPSQLPPPFTTEDLGANAKAILGAYGSSAISRGEAFSVARVGHARRPITIPNPIAQLRLSNTIATNWGDISKHFAASKISLSSPTIAPYSSGAERATSIASLSDLHEKRLLVSSGYKWILRTDISRFFPTLYTHSIPWALHTKPVAKAKQKDKSLLGNLLDGGVRACQDAQTMGVPIGPDTSHIIAEIVATSIDLLIEKSLKKWPIGYRHVDDYFLCFDRRSDAEDALAAIEGALHEFELDINVSKTSIGDVSDLQEDDWVHAIRSFQFDDTKPERQKDEIHRYFSLVSELCRRHSDENVVKFALRRIMAVALPPDVWPVLEAYLVRVAQSHHNCLQSVTNLAVTYAKNSYPINKDAFARLCSTIIAERAKSEHHSEVSWALWLIRELGLPVEDSTTQLVQSMRSSVCALLLLHLNHAGQLKKAPDTNFWDSLLDPKSLRGPLWLLAYEGVRRGWIAATNAGAIKADDMFLVLDNAGVSFFKDNKRLPLMFKQKGPVTKPLDQFLTIEWVYDETVEDYAD